MDCAAQGEIKPFASLFFLWLSAGRLDVDVEGREVMSGGSHFGAAFFSPSEEYIDCQILTFLILSVPVYVAIVLGCTCIVEIAGV